MPHLIDGKSAAAELRRDVAQKVLVLKSQHRLTPGLAVVLLGSDAASQVYVRNKIAQTSKAGMHSYHHELDETVSETQLLKLIDDLNSDASVNGILVQLPLPAHIDSAAVLSSISPDKDVDGFHIENVGRLTLGMDALVPCTPLGCMKLLHTCKPDLTGLHAVIVGRSNIVGKPLASLLLAANCTVTVAHSKTANLPAVCRQADILIAAVGVAQLVKGHWVKPGALVIDVGINRIQSESGKQVLTGDVDFEGAAKVAAAITPVPGGVGPMTIACLLHNTLQATCMQNGMALTAIES